MQSLGIPEIVLVRGRAGHTVHWFKFFGADGWMPACRSADIALPMNPPAVEGLTLACEQCQLEFDKLYYPDEAASSL
jgi:hypothetical protein